MITTRVYLINTDITAFDLETQTELMPETPIGDIKYVIRLTSRAICVLTFIIIRFEGLEFV